MLGENKKKMPIKMKMAPRKIKIFPKIEAILKI